jgi:hypothetical protein
VHQEAHWEMRITDLAEPAAKYCKKDGIFDEFGEHADKRKRAGQTKGCIKHSATIKEVHAKILAHEKWVDVTRDEDIASIISTRMNWAKEVFNAKKQPPIEMDLQAEGYKWQGRLVEKLEKVPHDRAIIWFCDYVGNKGKSALTKYIVRNMDGIKMANNHKDSAYLWNGERICLWDFSRKVQDKISYDCIEQIKNGLVVCGKYQSCNKDHAIPHCVIFANFMPDIKAMSIDRWDIITDFGDIEGQDGTVNWRNMGDNEGFIIKHMNYMNKTDECMIEEPATKRRKLAVLDDNKFNLIGWEEYENSTV